LSQNKPEHVQSIWFVLVQENPLLWIVCAVRLMKQQHTLKGFITQKHCRGPGCCGTAERGKHQDAVVPLRGGSTRWQAFLQTDLDRFCYVPATQFPGSPYNTVPGSLVLHTTQFPGSLVPPTTQSLVPWFPLQHSPWFPGSPYNTVPWFTGSPYNTVPGSPYNTVPGSLVPPTTQFPGSPYNTVPGSPHNTVYHSGPGDIDLRISGGPWRSLKLR